MAWKEASGKRTRRGNGEGMISQRADGKWTGRHQIGYTTSGSRRYVTVIAETEQKAIDALRRKIRETNLNGAPTEGVSTRTTVRAWAEDWLEQRVKTDRPKYYATQDSLIHKWIIPTIGGTRLTDLTPKHVRSVPDAVIAAGRSSTTAHDAQACLARLIRAAKAEGHIIPDRVLLVPTRTKAVNDRDAIPMDKAFAIMEVAAAKPDASRWVAAFLQGMRQGECLGLTWDAINLEAGTLDVSWQLQPLPYEDRLRGTFRIPHGYEVNQLVGSYHLVRPKSRAGYRVIPLVPWMTSALKTWREVSPKSPHGLVWPTATGGPRNAKDDRAEFVQLQRQTGVCKRLAEPKLGIKEKFFVLHEARHTTATILLELGVDPEVIKAIMGHSTVVTTRGYQHVSQTLAREAMAKLATRLNLNPPEQDEEQTQLQIEA